MMKPQLKRYSRLEPIKDQSEQFFELYKLRIPTTLVGYVLAFLTIYLMTLAINYVIS